VIIIAAADLIMNRRVVLLIMLMRVDIVFPQVIVLAMNSIMQIGVVGLIFPFSVTAVVLTLALAVLVVMGAYVPTTVTNVLI